MSIVAKLVVFFLTFLSTIYGVWIQAMYIWPACCCLGREGGETQTRGFGATSSDAQQTQINKQRYKQSESQRKSSQEFQRLSSRGCQKKTLCISDHFPLLVCSATIICNPSPKKLDHMMKIDWVHLLLRFGLCSCKKFLKNSKKIVTLEGDIREWHQRVHTRVRLSTL